MKTKKLQFVTFSQSKRLEALGFDWPVPSFYFKTGELCIKDKSELSGCKNWRSWYYWEATKGIRFSAPTVALALKWMRDVKSIPNVVSIDDFDYYSGYFIMDNIKYEIVTHGHIETFETAESALLDELITILEEEKEQ